MKILEFDIKEWSESREDIQKVLQVLSSIKAHYHPKDRHWYHHSLMCTSQMITTDLFPAKVGRRLDALEIELDPIDGVIFLSMQNESEEVPLDGQSQIELFEQIQNIYGEFGIDLDSSIAKDFSSLETDVNLDIFPKYWRMMQFTDLMLRFLKSENYLYETSHINLWTHHFDLAMLWFSGKKVDGVDPLDQDKSMQQMNFGLSAGDDFLDEPYYYITAYPFNDSLTNEISIKGVDWETKKWKGAVLPYSEIIKQKDQREFLLEFWNKTLEAYKKLENI